MLTMDPELGCSGPGDLGLQASDAIISEDLEEEGLKSIIIDGGCQCSLLRFRIRIPAEYQKTGVYQNHVGFQHCYCHACRNAVSALTQTTLTIPKEMIQWATRAKLANSEAEEGASTPSSRRSSRSRRRSSSGAPGTKLTDGRPQSPDERAPTRGDGSISPLQRGMDIVTALKAAKLQSSIDAVKQDPNFETDFVNVDTAVGCCCLVDDEDNLKIVSSTESQGPADLRDPKLTSHGVHVIPQCVNDAPPPSPSTSGRRSSVGRGVGGPGGYHKRIWKRERGVGGRDCSTSDRGGDDSPLGSPRSTSLSLASASGSTAIDTPGRTDSPAAVTGEATEKQKEKAGLWSKVKGKASAVISSKDKANPDPKVEDNTPTTCETQPASNLAVLRFEAQLLHQQQSDLSSQPSDLHNPLPIPWPFKEFTTTTRDGRSSHRGFCSWCGGNLTYRHSASLHEMIDIYAGSIDDPGKAMKCLGFLREHHCEKALETELGGRLGTEVGHERDAGVERLKGCSDLRLWRGGESGDCEDDF